MKKKAGNDIIKEYCRKKIVDMKGNKIAEYYREGFYMRQMNGNYINYLDWKQ